MQVNYSLSKLWNDKVIIKYKFDNSVCKFSFLGCRFIACVLYQRCSNSNQIIQSRADCPSSSVSDLSFVSMSKTGLLV